MKHSILKKNQVKKCLTKETGCLATSPLLKAGRGQTSRRNEFYFLPPKVTMGWVMKSNSGMQMYKGVILCSIQRSPGGMPPFHKSGRKVICHTKVPKNWNNFRKSIAIWQNSLLSSQFSMFSTSFPLSLLSQTPNTHTNSLIYTLRMDKINQNAKECKSHLQFKIFKRYLTSLILQKSAVNSKSIFHVPSSNLHT